MAATAEKKDTLTPVAIASYPFVFKPTKNQKNEEQFSITLVFPPNTDLEALKKVIAQAAVDKFGADKAAKALRSGPWSNPLRALTDDEAEDKGYPKGSHMLRAKSKVKPGVVSRAKNAEGKAEKLLDESLLYPGALVRAAVRFFGYDNESKGVGCGLTGLQVWDSTSPRIDGTKDASDMFDADLTAEEVYADPFKTK
jgi:hypothetical protein